MTSNERVKIRTEYNNRVDAESKLKELLLLDSNSSEIWKDIPGFEKLYQASNLGNIRQLPFVYRSNKNILVYRKYRVATQNIKEGYYQTLLTDLNGVNYYKGTHRWVMIAFYGVSELQVDHINGIKTDNRLENLRYVNASDNINHVKTLYPEKFNSTLHGAQSNGKGKWTSSFSIENKQYNLGNFETEKEANEVYLNAKYNWESFGIAPKRIRSKRITSEYKGIGFHKLSGKWRVRIGNVYFGLFESECKALRIYNIASFLHKRGRLLDKEIIFKIKEKYTKDKRYDRTFIHLETNFKTKSALQMANYLGVNYSTFNHWKVNKILKNKGIKVIYD